MTEADEICTTLRKQGIYLKEKWLKDRLQEAQGETPMKKAEHVYQIALMHDFNEIAEGSLPQELKTLHDVYLKGPSVIQIDEMVNIAVGVEKRDSVSGWRMLKMLGTDGQKEVICLEQSSIPSIVSSLATGFKVCLVNVYVRRGILLLNSDNTTVLGGSLPLKCMASHLKQCPSPPMEPMPAQVHAESIDRPLSESENHPEISTKPQETRIVNKNTFPTASSGCSRKELKENDVFNCTVDNSGVKKGSFQRDTHFLGERSSVSHVKGTIVKSDRENQPKISTKPQEPRAVNKKAFDQNMFRPASSGSSGKEFMDNDMFDYTVDSTNEKRGSFQQETQFLEERSSVAPINDAAVRSVGASKFCYVGPSAKNLDFASSSSVVDLTTPFKNSVPPSSRWDCIDQMEVADVNDSVPSPFDVEPSAVLSNTNIQNGICTSHNPQSSQKVCIADVLNHRGLYSLAKRDYFIDGFATAIKRFTVVEKNVSSPFFETKLDFNDGSGKVYEVKIAPDLCEKFLAVSAEEYSRLRSDFVSSNNGKKKEFKKIYAQKFETFAGKFAFSVANDNEIVLLDRI